MIRFLTLLAISACLVSPLRAAERPNVLMIAIDDLRPMLGCYGDRRIQTPNIDRIARRAVLFERAYCQYAKCGTSRLSLMTGLRPDAVGVFSNNKADVAKFRQRRPDAVSLPRWLKQHGYHTQSFGKIYHDEWDQAADWTVPSFPGRPREMWEITNDADPTGPTLIAERLACPIMQSPDVSDDHLFAGRMTREVLRTVRELPSDRPHFLAVGYRRPHLPFVAPRRYFDLYQPDLSWLPVNALPPESSPAMAWFNSDGYVGSAARVGLTMPRRPTRQEAIEWNGFEMRSYLDVPYHGPIPIKRQLEIYQAYAACISYVDAQIGKLLDELESADGWEQTIVVLWSDHGWHLGEHGAWGKMTNFEIATRVPLLIAAPGIGPGRTQSLAELVDLYPTLCDLTGLEPPDHVQGESLLAALREPSVVSQDVAASQYSRFQDRFMGRAVRTARYRFVEWTEVASGERVQRELYDHSIDPHEQTNQADNPRYAHAVRQLASRLSERFPRDSNEGR